MPGCIYTDELCTIWLNDALSALKIQIQIRGIHSNLKNSSKTLPLQNRQEYQRKILIHQRT